MANNYSQFSEQLTGITSAGAEWLKMVLDLVEPENTEQLCKELGIEYTTEVDGTITPHEEEAIQDWPQFEWQLGGDGEEHELQLSSDEYAETEQVALLIQSYFRKFQPDGVFTITGSETCSKPRFGEFGGWWLCISATEIRGGNCHSAAAEAAAKMKDGANRCEHGMFKTGAGACPQCKSSHEMEE